MTDANWGEISPMLDELSALGVTLPETTRKVQATMAALLDESHFTNTVPDALSRLTTDQLFAAVNTFTFMREFDIARRNTRGIFQHTLSAEACADLLEHTDDVLDQLRPAFDKAARVIVAAHKAGLRAHHSDREILHLGHPVLDAWKAVPEAVRTLDAIAYARLRLARAIGAPPAADQASGAFCSSAGLWNQSLQNRWLALVDTGLKLNTDAETREACQRPRRQPLAPSNPQLDSGPNLGRAVLR